MKTLILLRGNLDCGIILDKLGTSINLYFKSQKSMVYLFFVYYMLDNFLKIRSFNFVI